MKVVHNRVNHCLNSGSFHFFFFFILIPFETRIRVDSIDFIYWINENLISVLMRDQSIQMMRNKSHNFQIYLIKYWSGKHFLNNLVTEHDQHIHWQLFKLPDAKKSQVYVLFAEHLFKIFIHWTRIGKRILLHTIVSETVFYAYTLFSFMYSFPHIQH